MRSSLYLKDEDFRLSFLYGNFTTISSLSKEEKEFIIEYKLSPLYISVHATDIKIRNKMLRNKKAPDIMEQLSYLSRNKIRFHLQIVLLPGINDGIILLKTLKALSTLGKAVLSIGIVPVGITKFRKYPKIKSFNCSLANKTINIVERFKKENKQKRIYLSDEFFLKAHRKIPKKKYYHDFPQIENGIGKIRLFSYEFFHNIHYRKLKYSKIAVLCSNSSYIMFKNISLSLKKHGLEMTPYPVPTLFWGKKINVCGLLTGKDILKYIKEYRNILINFEKVFISKVIFNDDALTLDNITHENIKSSLNNLEFCDDSGKAFALSLCRE